LEEIDGAIAPVAAESDEGRPAELASAPEPEPPAPPPDEGAHLPEPGPPSPWEEPEGEAAETDAGSRRARQGRRFTLGGWTRGTEATPASVDLPAGETAGDALIEDDESARRAARMAVAARFSEDRVDETDDLRLIPGIGPLMERMLQSMNIRTFRQVASFTSEDIEEVAAALRSFPGRIERDDWVGGAKEQHFLKYGERL
jgi:predicted flap endonuclease-1-like 5' DNA nuclease